MTTAAGFFVEQARKAADTKDRWLASEASENLAARIKAGFDASFRSSRRQPAPSPRPGRRT